MIIYISSDHGGFHLKKILIDFITSQLHKRVVDVGPTHLDPSDDYPDFVAMMAEKMQSDKDSLGITICRSGVGVTVAANKYDHLRAGLGLNEKQVSASRNDDNINVLALASDFISAEEAKKMVKAFIETSFSNLERHTRRLAKLTDYAHRARSPRTHA